MTIAESILARLAINGWRVEMHGYTPNLVKERPEAEPARQELLDELKKHRIDVIRHIVIASIVVRSPGKSIYGYDSDTGRARRPTVKKGIPWNWDRICVEGDSQWLQMPKGNKPPAKKKRRKKMKFDDNRQNVH